MTEPESYSDRTQCRVHPCRWAGHFLLQWSIHLL